MARSFGHLHEFEGPYENNRAAALRNQLEPLCGKVAVERERTIAANTTTAEGVELVGFLATFTLQDSPTLEVNATPGKYVLICNIVDHYRRGMAASFTVT